MQLKPLERLRGQQPLSVTCEEAKPLAVRFPGAVDTIAVRNAAAAVGIGITHIAPAMTLAGVGVAIGLEGGVLTTVAGAVGGTALGWLQAAQNNALAKLYRRAESSTPLSHWRAFRDSIPRALLPTVLTAGAVSFLAPALGLVAGLVVCIGAVYVEEQRHSVITDLLLKERK